MKLTIRICALMLVLALWGSPCASAEDTAKPLRPVVSSYMAMIGSGHLADTYLTPLKYNGTSTSFLYRRAQAMAFDPSHWTMQLSIGVDADFVKNQSKNTTMYAGAINASWGMLRCWKLPQHITLGAGPATSIDLGLIYLNRNSNNPVSAKAAWTVDAMAYASWSHTFWRLPVTFSYQGRLPVTGAFFAPDYGQLYYQIYLGDRDNLAHAAWWGNYFHLDNLVCADLHLGNTSLRLGYRCDVFSSKVNNIVSRRSTHMFVLGIATEWLSLRPGSKRVAQASTISPF